MMQAASRPAFLLYGFVIWDTRRTRCAHATTQHPACRMHLSLRRPRRPPTAEAHKIRHLVSAPQAPLRVLPCEHHQPAPALLPLAATRLRPKQLHMLRTQGPATRKQRSGADLPRSLRRSNPVRTLN